MLPLSGEGFQKDSKDGAELVHSIHSQNLHSFLPDYMDIFIFKYLMLRSCLHLGWVVGEATLPCSNYVDSMAPCGDHSDPSIQAPRKSLARTPATKRKLGFLGLTKSNS